MIANPSGFAKAGVLAASIVAGLMATSCVAPRSSPQQLEASNPTVTYKYRSDDELVQANQRAAEFCNRYQFTPQTASLSNDPDGSRVVVFECVSPSPTNASTWQYDPNLTYTYGTDQELLSASRNAQAYCASNAGQQVTSSIVLNPNGTKTVRFQCIRR